MECDDNNQFIMQDYENHIPKYQVQKYAKVHKLY